MKKKLVLAYPNLRWHKVDIQTLWNLNPSILCLLGKMVEDYADVTIIDAQFYDLSIEEFSERISKIEPDYVGISLLTSEYSAILHLAAAAVKGCVPNSTVIAGGVHPTIEYEQVIGDPNIEYVVRGDGEYVLRDLIKHLNGKGELPSEGLVYRDKGEIKVQPQSVIGNLSDLPMPDYELVDMEDYIMVGSRYGPLRPPEFPYVRMVVTRGCPVGCSFCQVEKISGHKVRSPDAERVIDELSFLKDRYAIKSFLIDDDNLVIKKKFFKQFLMALIERRLDLKFIIQSFAIFSLDDEMLALMKKAGCQGINIAIESGNQRVMNDIVLKPIDLTTVPALIEKVKSTGMFVLANFIIGFPGESWDEIRETISFAEYCGADYVKIFIAVPLKGTRMWDMAVELDAFDMPTDGIEVNWRFSQIRSDEWTARDVSILRAYEWDRINFGHLDRRRRVAEIWGMSEDELSDIRKATRDAVHEGYSEQDANELFAAGNEDSRKGLFKTDGGNLLVN
jgi:anaerobic magnesium-protoporphyrin IX monomethyl ester cyclase